MKNLTLLLAVILISATFSFAQKLSLTKTFKQAISEATDQQKPVFLIIEAIGIKPPSNLPKNVTVSFKSGIDNDDIITKINASFIVYKTVMTDTTIASVLRSANIKSFPAYIFMHPNKDVFYKDFGNSTLVEKYNKMLDKALIASKEKSISELAKDYEADRSNSATLKKLIDARKKAGIIDNAELVEKYVDNLKIGDFNDYQTVLYILEAGPYSDGTAYKLAYTNRKIIDSIYKSEPLAKRLALNHAIINNTMWDAARKKNLQRANSGANFTRYTYSKDYRAGEKAFNSQMLWYYSTVKDTASYLRTAIYFYDNHYMNISADSIKKIEARQLDALRKSRQGVSTLPTISNTKRDSLLKNVDPKLLRTESVTIVGTASTSSYANELNNAAWKFYELGTKNINYLTKAMIWSRRSIELSPNSAYYDTLAHLLYRMGYYEEAIKTQQDAIKKAGDNKSHIRILEKELEKFKKRTI